MRSVTLTGSVEMAGKGKAFDISIKSEIDRISKQVPRQFRSTIAPASATALNKTMGKTKTFSMKRLARLMGLQQNRFRDLVTTVRANKYRMKAGMRIRGKPVNVVRFGVLKTATGIKHGAWLPGRKKKLVKRAFLMPTKRKAPINPGERAYPYFVAYRKKGAERLDIKPIFGPWLPREFLKRGSREGPQIPLSKLAEKFAIKEFPGQYVRALDHHISKITGRYKSGKKVRK